MARRTQHPEEASDGQLIALVRGGDTAAFDGLYERHISIASTVARRNVDNPSDAEDIVAEAFQSVLQNLVAGKGPDTFFRAYLLSTVTRLSHHRNRKAGRTLPSGDDSTLDHAVGEPDAVVKAFESHTVAKAFRMLPERWQAVLWYLDVERMKPAAAAPLLGLSANAVSALALRAREGLRRQYLQCHVSEGPTRECAEYVAKLGSFIRGGLSGPSARKVRTHLEGCASCTAVVAELRDVEGSMKAVLLPLVTGIPVAAWAASGSGLGIIGSLAAPAKVAAVAPLLAQPVAATIMTAAAAGLVLGAAGVIDYFSQGTPPEQRTVQTAAVPSQATVVPPPETPAPSPSPSDIPSVPVVPATEEAPPPVAEPEPQTTTPAVEPPVPSAPEVTPSPTRTPDPPPKRDAQPAMVTSSVGTTKDGNPFTTPFTIEFTVSGTAPLGRGTAVFSAPDGARIVGGSLEAPDGWQCSLENESKAVCSTESAKRRNLHFHLTVESRHRSAESLSYGLDGTGIQERHFVHNY
ncbi:zf-HC2 domain-containing protein [Paenarthrobacter sp. NPDC089714]|uniref:zf-HC2 domain-containing protein n=1 Tax=Paenarthrobacter sp. NPDC089714 TaxID=3364377 RepID=UPI0038028344